MKENTAMTSKPQRTSVDLGEQKVLADINEYGWHLMNVLEDDGQPPWSFTIGLHETWQHPELIIAGRSRNDDFQFRGRQC
jgi:hypothetical protein